MKQIIGYIVGLLGLAALAASFDTVRKMLTFIPASITSTYLMIAGVVLIVVAALLLFRTGSGTQATEVPIYRGKEIVGYRRVK